MLPKRREHQEARAATDTSSLSGVRGRREAARSNRSRVADGAGEPFTPTGTVPASWMRPGMHSIMQATKPTSTSRFYDPVAFSETTAGLANKMSSS